MSANIQEAHSLRERYFGDDLCLHSVIYPVDYCTSSGSYCGLSAVLRETGAPTNGRGVMPLETFEWLVDHLRRDGYRVHELVFGTLHSDQDILARQIAKWIRRARTIDPDGFIIVNCDILTPHGYERLAEAGANAVWTFIEVLAPEVYRRKHRGGLKASYEQRLAAPQRIREAGLQVGNALLWGLSNAWTDELKRFVDYANDLGGFDFVATPVQQDVTIAPGVRVPDWFDVKPPRVVTEELYLQILAKLRLAFPQARLVANTRLRPEFVYSEAARIADMCNGYVWCGAPSHPQRSLAAEGRVASQDVQMDFYNPGGELREIRRQCSKHVVLEL